MEQQQKQEKQEPEVRDPLNGLGRKIMGCLFLWSAVIWMAALTGKYAADAVEAVVSQNTAAYGKVALTFDDGPHPVWTRQLLDGLKERNIPAAFFVIGENIPGNEALIRRMEEEGHLIGNHTYTHVKISDLSEEAACQEIRKTSDLVKAITGHDTEFIRPPFGAWNKKLEQAITMIPILWDVDPLDWMTKDAQLIDRRVLDTVQDGDIILLHDCYASSVQAALELIDQLHGQGYEFVRADKLILE